MALTFILNFTQGATVSAGTITDATVYGGAEDDRNERGNYLLLSKNDKAGTRTYLTVSNTTPLSTLSWAFTSTIDGWHQATLLSAKIWSSGQSYIIGDVVYLAATNLFYRSLTAHSNISPNSGSGPANWAIITDFTAIQTGYTNIEVFDYSFNVESRTDLLGVEKLDEAIGDDFLAKLNPSDAVELLNFVIGLDTARSKAAQDEFSDVEEIMRAIEETA